MVTQFLIGLDSFAATPPVWLLTIVGGALADRRGVQHALLINGLTTVVGQAAIARSWLRAPASA